MSEVAPKNREEEVEAERENFISGAKEEVDKLKTRIDELWKYIEEHRREKRHDEEFFKREEEYNKLLSERMEWAKEARRENLIAKTNKKDTEK